MGKGFVCVYKHTQPNHPYPYTNRTFFVQPQFLFSPQHDITTTYGVTIISHNQPSPVSNLTTTTEFETDRSNDDDTHYI